MRYEQFALLYDKLMNDVPYDKWVEFTEESLQQAGMKETKILDVACGTGNVTLPLVQKGYDMTGVDLSEEMLAVAQQKLGAKGHFIPFYQQDMRELDVPGEFDCVTIFCDSLNYVLQEEGIQETFKRVFQHLRKDGLFLFDVHSLYKVHHIFQNETYTVNGEEIALIWNCFPGEVPDSVEHELSFFVQDPEEGVYHRFDEYHIQRAYPVELITKWLEEAGFSVIRVMGDFERMEVTEQTERIFFMVKKNG
ncbi:MULTISPECIES: class I SAM-dependent methyltransferase [Bacillus cereus group]|uniref:Methyltransferase type 11 n=1 Tax=Bacillus cytotoxicus (strain DSM 22905 / CIP 110041 / 391-98 / NVH 391-98) TaxID=315749 RepID=A7GT23_BACCN|nr:MULTISPECIES: class I SAM-dependent methyltransferase [Bacillus cereus group]ABS23281.1 Methyltransferase type 11 [Bacillus cytotoxicus NVH 391-98]AWC45907.1 class I SAM-dependent methyltransferase [Bacillus cytotoxicus]MDH2865037.1 methyltransferase domain-containing protein [Bacillus cytotoxicus]MDH2884032.1 methyltransferase domain-containing protein [Bacillus cytotoxicus]MDH2888693.1 methyltransferase domain-containing protein [Bacillus cytotoxicus]